MAERELAIKVSAKDFATGVLRGIGREVRGLDRTVGQGLSNIGRNLERGLVIGGSAAAGGLALAVREAGNFEASLNTINTVAQLTPDRLGKIGDEIRGLSRETGTSLDDLTTGYYDLVSAGIDAAHAQDVLVASNTLAIGGLSTTAESVDLLTTAINAYGGDATKAGHYADVFAQAIGAGKVTAAELATSFAQVAPLAASMGIEIEELAAGYAQLTARGVPAAEAATQMRAAIVALQRPTGELEKLQKDLNVNFLEIAQKEGLASAYQLMVREAKKAGVELIDLTGRVEGQSYALQVTGDNWDSYVTNLEKVEKASGVAKDQMSERQQGLNYQLNRLKANVRDAAIEIGTALLPEMSNLAGEAVDFLTSHRSDIKGFAQDLAGGIRDGVGWLKSLDWVAITGTLQSLGGVGKGLLDAFLKMPSWVQVAVVSGWGLNKLSGGAVGTIVGQLASGLIKGVLNMNAGVVNINAATVNGGGFGGGPGGPRRGFDLLGLLGLATGVGGAVVQGTAGATDTRTRALAATGSIAGFTLAGLRYGGIPGAVAGLAAGSTLAAGQETLNFAGIVGDGQTSLERTIDSRMSDNLEELIALRGDVQNQITAGGGDPLRDILKGAFVDPGLHDKLGDIDRRIQYEALQTVGVQRNQHEQLREERHHANISARAEAQQAAQTRRLSAIEGIDAGIARSAAATAAKDFSAHVTVITRATVNVDGREVATTTAREAIIAGRSPVIR